MSDVVNLLDDLRVGDPILLEFGDAKTYGRVFNVEGTPFHGVFPIICLRTPHGSILRSGRVWVRRIVSVEDLARLADLEAAARNLNTITIEAE